MEELKSFNEVFSMAAKGIQDAIAEYGPEAVDLGLMVYRLEGIREVSLGVLFSVFTFVAYYKLFKFSVNTVWPWLKATPPREDRSWVAVPIVLVSLFLIFLLGAATRIFSVYHWAAAFGYPEVLIAHKALQAAGLM